jgi:predicted transcriptional regulator
MKTLIDIPSESMQLLEWLAQKEKRSKASVVREALAEYLKTKQTEAAEDAFGAWKNRPIDALLHQQNLREEWE